MAGSSAVGLSRRLACIVLGVLLVAGGSAPTPAHAEDPPIRAAELVTPVISGTPRVGEILQVASPDAGTDYQWYRAGRPIPGATGPGYELTAADAGRPVWVTSSRPDPAPATAHSRLVLALPDWEQRVIVWDDELPARPPAGLEDAVAVAVGRDHALALRGDGTVVGWGSNEYGQLRIPAGLDDVVAITSAAYFSLALRSDGTVVSWGDDRRDYRHPPAGLADVVAISSGLSHTLALRSDGTVVAWGFGSSPPFTQAQVPPGLEEVVAIAAGGNHSLALKSDGTVVAWGYDYDGQSRPPAGLDDVVAIAGASTTSIALHADGRLTQWGQVRPADLPAISDGIAIAAGRNRAAVLRAGGSVAAWDHAHDVPTSAPRELRTATAIALGEGASIALARVWTDEPTLSGAAAVGEVLTAEPGDWVPGAGLAYQWLRNGTELAGATDARYRLGVEDLGERLSVRVSGSLAGTALGAVTSGPSPRVAPGGLAATTPVVTGVLATGRVLTVVPGEWRPAPGFTYQWLRDGRPIKGATGARYRLRSRDAGARIAVRATGSAPGYHPHTATSAASAKVLKAGRPTVKGTRATGSKLKVARGSWTVGVRFSYRWFRDGRPIKRATRATYTLTGADAGHRISVEVTGRRPGYATVRLASPRTTRILRVATPRIKGIREVGRLLVARPGAWTAGTRFTYRWYAGGRLVSASSAPSLWLRAPLRGRRLVVEVTGRRSGYGTATRTSAVTGAIR